MVTVKDGATPVDGQAVEYDVAFTPRVGAPVPADGVFAAGGSTGADGTRRPRLRPGLAGSYTVTVRTVGSHIAAAPFTFVAGESAIKWADGVSASSPQNGSDTYTGTLALTNAPAPRSAGRLSTSTGTAGYVGLSTRSPRHRRASARRRGRNHQRYRRLLGRPDRPRRPGGSRDRHARRADTALHGPARTSRSASRLVPPVTSITVTKANVFGARPLRASRSSSTSS